MSPRFFATSSKAWSAMFDAIQKAKRSIHLEMYIFGGSTKGYDFLKALAERARAGVEVVVILDIIGTDDLKERQIKELRDAGGEVLFYGALFRRTHRKLLVIDGETAFVGGVNIHRKFAFWNDLQVRLTGAVAHAAARSFVNVYKECGGKRRLQEPDTKGLGMARARFWFVEHGVGGKHRALKRYYKRRIANAEKSVVIVTPYFVPPRWLLKSLKKALARKVAVEIVSPISSDHFLIGRISLYYFSVITAFGAKCYMEKAMNHAKAMVVDSKEAIVGSQNIDALSFDWNIESGVAFDDGSVVKDLEAIIEGWKKGADVFDDAVYRPRWYDRALAPFLRIARIMF